MRCSPADGRRPTEGRETATLLQDIQLQYTAHPCTALHCPVLHCTVLHCTALHCTALQCSVLHCTALHCTTMLFNVLHTDNTTHCTALHCMALHVFNIYFKENPAHGRLLNLTKWATTAPICFSFLFLVIVTFCYGVGGIWVGK